MAEQVDQYVGARLKARRILSGVSQTILADSVGLTFQQIQKYERGTDRVSASKLYLFAKFLDVPISYFFDGLPKSLAGKGVRTGAGLSEEASVFADAHTLKLVRFYYKIADAKNRKVVLELIRALGRKK